MYRYTIESGEFTDKLFVMILSYGASFYVLVIQSCTTSKQLVALV